MQTTSSKNNNHRLYNELPRKEESQQFPYRPTVQKSRARCDELAK